MIDIPEDTSHADDPHNSGNLHHGTGTTRGTGDGVQDSRLAPRKQKLLKLARERTGYIQRMSTTASIIMAAVVATSLQWEISGQSINAVAYSVFLFWHTSLVFSLLAVYTSLIDDCYMEQLFNKVERMFKSGSFGLKIVV
ncbi:hypothetical protein L873DRAFT_1802640 [Choiromyces venosus 120613-1]|uniref:Uncharacterized protein n=1 Tax=Choiromyces venosus 120613-1 TaxID=1336337 RepID=A0A3N4K1B0_9PEZI|nr:hypothetical protein L873DRAFT_1802640 [Choiromyces venosus 120613-1]